MIGQNQIRKLNPNGGEGGLIVPALISDGKTLTIIGWGSWMLLECGGGLIQKFIYLHITVLCY